MIDITRRLIWFDLETTGPDPEKDRIVSIWFREYRPRDPETGEVPEPREFSQILDPGCSIPPEATAKHGLTNEDVFGKPDFASLAPALLRGFVDCDYGGYNIKFYDLPLLQAEFARAGHQWSYADAHIVDVLRLWNKLRTRTLSDAVEYWLGREHQTAHTADGDVRETIEVFEAMIAQCCGKIPGTPQEIHALLFPVDANAVDPDGRIVFRGDGEAVINFGKKWKGTPLRRMARRDLEWIATKADGMTPAVKQICRDCLAGKFPERKQ